MARRYLGAALRRNHNTPIAVLCGIIMGVVLALYI
jgi:hypothetical protein